MKTLTCLLGVFMVALCHAADFPSAGGDIASNGADGWNGAKPGSGEEAKFTKAGTYTASGDVTFGSVNFASDGLVFDLRSGNRTVTLNGATPIVGPSAANATNYLKGGSWNGTGMKFQSIGDGYTLMLSDGAVITDAGTFSPGYSLKDNTIILTGASEIHANEFKLHEWSKTGTKLDVGDGSKVYSTGNFLVQGGGSTPFVGNHLVDVHGANSLLQVGGDFEIGRVNSDNVVRIRDGASFSVEGTSKSVIIGGGGRHLLEVLNGATATVKGTKFSTCDNRILVSNATYTASWNFYLGTTSAVTGNVVTVTGPDAVFDWKGNVFGTGCGNVFELSDGATWRMGGNNATLMGSASNNLLRVTGGAVLENVANPAGDNNFYIGNDNETKGGNTIEILDGANVRVERFFVRGVGNRVVVSNATLRAWAVSSNEKYGIWLGHGSNSSGNTLVVCGATPSVTLNGCTLQNGSTIRFEVPKDGYAADHVPVTTRALSPTSTATEKFEIDCSAWAANPNAVRKLVLMRTTTDIASATADWILAQNSGLPESIRLKVTDREVILQKRDGFILSFR